MARVAAGRCAAIDVPVAVRPRVRQAAQCRRSRYGARGSLAAAAATLVLAAAGAAAAPSLQLSVSKRIPCCTDTVTIAAHYADWEAPQGDHSVLFAVEVDGVEKPIGRALPAADRAHPFNPGVEWSPKAPGAYRISARINGTSAVARLLLPVVAQDVFFCWYGQTRPEVEWITHHLTAGDSEISALHARGVKALKHVGGVCYLGGARPEQIRKDLDMAALGPRILKDYTAIDPWDGIAIDELGMWDQHPEQTPLALAFWEVLKQTRAARPDKFLATWQFAALTPLECNMFRDTVDLVMCEVYQNYFRAWYDQHTFYEYLKQRIDVARAMMIIKQTVIGLSITSDNGGITADELEDQVRTIRALAPEMRGLAFFSTSSCDSAVLKRANECCYRYFVKPAVGLFSEADLTLSDWRPQARGIVRISATVHNVGGMDARDVKVRLWDGDPANGGTQIGSTHTIPVLPAARWVDPKALGSLSWDPPEAMRRDGFGMVTITAPWQAGPRPHELWAEIVADPQYTTIRAFQAKRLSLP